MDHTRNLVIKYHDLNNIYINAKRYYEAIKPGLDEQNNLITSLSYVSPNQANGKSFNALRNFMMDTHGVINNNINMICQMYINICAMYAYEFVKINENLDENQASNINPDDVSNLDKIGEVGTNYMLEFNEEVLKQVVSNLEFIKNTLNDKDVEIRTQVNRINPEFINDGSISSLIAVDATTAEIDNIINIINQMLERARRIDSKFDNEISVIRDLINVTKQIIIKSREINIYDYKLGDIFSTKGIGIDASQKMLEAYDSYDLITTSSYYQNHLNDAITYNDAYYDLKCLEIQKDEAFVSALTSLVDATIDTILAISFLATGNVTLAAGYGVSAISGFAETIWASEDLSSLTETMKYRSRFDTKTVVDNKIDRWCSAQGMESALVRQTINGIGMFAPTVAATGSIFAGVTSLVAGATVMSEVTGKIVSPLVTKDLINKGYNDEIANARSSRFVNNTVSIVTSSLSMYEASRMHALNYGIKKTNSNSLFDRMQDTHKKSKEVANRIKERIDVENVDRINNTTTYSKYEDLYARGNKQTGKNGYGIGKIDSNFGNKTKNEVKEWLGKEGNTIDIYDSPKRPHEITFINPDGSVNKVVSQLDKPFKPSKHNKPNISKNHRKKIDGVKIDNKVEINGLNKNSDEYKKLMDQKPSDCPNIDIFTKNGGRVTYNKLADGSIIWSFDIRMKVFGRMRNVRVDYKPYKLTDGTIVYSPNFSKYQFSKESEILFQEYGYELTGNRKKDREIYKQILEKEGIEYPDIDEGYVAHHAMPPGLMQWVPQDIHNMFSHKGGFNLRGEYVAD